jgi:2,4-dienoyl-CoA reductase-like NADH-dependent reductase (Old Yellow Enzyme family)
MKGPPMASLLEPLRLRGVKLPNRIGVSPMSQYMATDGYPTEWHQVHLGSRAVGRNGLVMTEAIAVAPEGRITPRCLGIWDETRADRLGVLAAFISEQGSVPGIQLAHAGRKASTAPPSAGGGPLGPEDGGWEVIGPSALPFGPEHPTPTAMDDDTIDRVVDDFAVASVRAWGAGFRVIELHAAHGYLLHSFLSPLTNHRDDGYGGDLHGRARLLLRTVERIRTAVPDEAVLFVRLSATDWVDGGWTIEDTIDVSRLLRERGVDLIDCSSGGIIPGVNIPLAPGYQVPFAERVRSGAGVPTAAVGLITEPAQADVIIRTGQADLVLVGRESLRDPYFPLRAARELGNPVLVAAPQPYERAW